MSKDPLGLVGVVLDLHIRVDAFADEGDLCVIYKGRHLRTDSPVAIRCLNLPTTLDPGLATPLVENFQKENLLHQRLAPGNPNIVQTLGSGTTVATTTGQTIPYVIHEWLEGCTLAAHIEKRRAGGTGAWPLAEVFSLLDPAADALAYLHGHGIAHHAINPNNLFVVDGGANPVVKLADLGNARSTEDTGKDEGAGIRLLLPQYAAPEQVDKQIGPLGKSTDVYSLAVLVIELLAGGLSTRDVAAAVLADPKNRPSPKKLGLRLRADVEEALERALAVDPSKRFADAAAFWKKLKAAAAATASASKPRPPTKPVRMPHPLSKATLVGLAPTKLPTAGLPAVAPDAEEAKPIVAPAVRTSDRADLPLADAGAPPPADEPDLFIPALGRPSLALRLALGFGWVRVAMGAGVRGAVDRASRARQWLRAHVWSWVVAHASASASPRERAVLAGAVLGTLLFFFLVVRLGAAAFVTREAAQTSPASSEGAVVTAAAPSVAPSAAPPDESAAVELPDETPSAPPEVPPPPQIAKRFVRAAATTAVDTVSADLQGCHRPGGLSGPGSVSITFGNEGTVVHTALRPPYAKAPEGACILEHLRGARMAPFRGPPGAINYSFTLQD